MNKFEKQKMELDIELRDLRDQIKNKSIKGKFAKEKLNELQSRKAEIDKQCALASAPIEKRASASSR